MDGVTTALELELGVYPVADWIASREGDAVIHYGASVGHMGARLKLFHDADLGSWATLSPERTDLLTFSDFEDKDTTQEERTRLKELMDRGLDEGGLGFGLGITYTPGASRSEIFEIFELASEQDVPLFLHTRSSSSGGTLGAFQEGIANAAATGASLHFVHLNSSSGELAPTVLSLIRGARDRGIDITTEAYPYTAGSTRIESASYDNWEGRDDADFARLLWPATGERLTAESFARYREEGGWVISGSRSEETNAWIVAQPDVMVASDGIPFLYGPAHPRGAGTFSRILGHYSRDQQTIGLMDALKKMTLLPAQRLEQIAPVMRNKGRIRLGADADITLFDPDRVLDRSTYEQGDIPSEGIVHVLVSGTFVVRNSELIEGVFPGRAIKSERLN
jgi:dihydroorotase